MLFLPYRKQGPKQGDAKGYRHYIRSVQGLLRGCPERSGLNPAYCLPYAHCSLEICPHIDKSAEPARPTYYRHSCQLPLAEASRICACLQGPERSPWAALVWAAGMPGGRVMGAALAPGDNGLPKEFLWDSCMPSTDVFMAAKHRSASPLGDSLGVAAHWNT